MSHLTCILDIDIIPLHIARPMTVKPDIPAEI
jgi:hypothetical protein